ncbi:hypothetical protein [Corynebacterium meitnerae]|uniref:Uncharacterized protein n=1 Tax=Corynebacterium meitnerae TaxID=2913498 RepID=A0A9X3RKP6_9CORY|nr:hypothetical protein [Corynebacterium meitnerae]MCZ9294172.1 hypothetical protein [Corynebacterium meitnerae]
MDGIVARQHNKVGAGQSFLGGADTIANGKMATAHYYACVDKTSPHCPPRQHKVLPNRTNILIADQH